MLTFISFVASFNTLFTILSASFLLGFFSILRYKLICKDNKDMQNMVTHCKLYNKYKRMYFYLSHIKQYSCSLRIDLLPVGVSQPLVLTCSVRSTEELLYLQFVSEPSVASRSRKRMREEHHTISSQFVIDSRNVLWLCRS